MRAEGGKENNWNIFLLDKMSFLCYTICGGVRGKLTEYGVRATEQRSELRSNIQYQLEYYENTKKEGA